MPDQTLQPTRRMASRWLMPFALVAVTLTAGLGGSARTSSRWIATDLGTLNGGSSAATAINHNGVVVGQSQRRVDEIFTAPFLWSGNMVDLSMPSDVFASATAINRANDVIGILAGMSVPDVSVIWKSGHPNARVFVPCLFSCQAWGVNDAGQVVGTQRTPNGLRGFVWAGSGPLPLGAGPSGSATARDINNVGQIVGQDLTGRAALWMPSGEVVDLGVPGVAYAVNDLGHVVGQSAPPGGQRHAFLWTPTGQLVDLGTLGGLESTATGINDTGQVVGYSQTKSGAVHAFLWTAAAGLTDLGTLGGRNSAANGINNAGQVVGQSETATSETHAVLWNECQQRPPEITDARATPSVLWPPNHKMVRVRVDYNVTTSCGATATSTLSVSVKDAVHRAGEAPADVAVVVDEHTVLLRAERSGLGHGRTYTIWVQVTDSAGLTATEALSVIVPKSKGH